MMRSVGCTASDFSRTPRQKKAPTSTPTRVANMPLRSWTKTFKRGHFPWKVSLISAPFLRAIEVVSIAVRSFIFSNLPERLGKSPLEGLSRTG